MEGEERYSTSEAAKILRTTERTIRRRLERGDLEGWRDPTTGRWWASARSIHKASRIDRRKPLRNPQTPPQRLQTSGQG